MEIFGSFWHSQSHNYNLSFHKLHERYSSDQKFWFRTIWFWKGHENYLMQKITFNGPNFRWKFLGVFGIHRLTTIIILFTNFMKPYSSEPKLRCRRFGTFWRFLTFNLEKLSLKAETSRMEMDFWKKFSHFALQG